MNIQQRTTFTTFMTRAATRCTCVLPRPSKNALMDIVAAIETTPSSRQRVYSSATACTSGTPIIVFDLLTEGNIERVILGEQIGTRVDAEGVAE